MWRNFRRLSTVLSLWILCIGAGPTNPTQIRGDYDGDGYQDLSVALVRPLGTNLYRTEFLARGSSGKQVFYMLPTKTDAFANGKYFTGLPTALASVLVTSIAEPLLWTFLNPQTLQTVQLRYGLPGDSIVNAANFDGDALDDIFVVRAGAANEFGDGKQYLHWLIALTSSGGAVTDMVFGMKGDKVFTFYKDGVAHMGAVRLETTGVCAGQFGWYFLEYNADPAKRAVSSTCWGLSGDIPIIPAQVNGKMKVAISRPTGAIQVAYVRDFSGATSETINLGLGDSIPGIASLSAKGSNFFWHQRATVGLGDASFVGIRGSDGGLSVIQFGITSNVIIRPDGSVVQPTETGTLTGSLTGGSAQCAQIVQRGYLWKPSSQDSGGTREGYPMIYLTRYSANNNCLQVLSSNFQPISCLGVFNSSRIYEGYGCGLDSAAPCNGRTNSSSLATFSQQVGGTSGGYVFDPSNKNCYEVPDFSKRSDRR